MAIKTISQFDAATPTSDDKILFEQNGEGKSATLADLPVSTKTQATIQSALSSQLDVLNTKVNTSDVLTLEEIQAASDLTGKVAGADSIKTLQHRGMLNIIKFFAESYDKTSVTFLNVPIAFRISGIVVGNANGSHFFRYCSLFMNGAADQNSIDSGTISSTDNGNGMANITISPVNQWGYFNLIVFY